ncbi:hypothetical protein JCM10908_001303 [Rhodotorula pacifica]|uniref:uncharacterized protein n=1 Tax=Rhodotorula pacifica TaxID=1495444 RepID=UPI00317A64D2
MHAGDEKLDYWSAQRRGSESYARGGGAIALPLTDGNDDHKNDNIDYAKPATASYRDLYLLFAFFLALLALPRLPSLYTSAAAQPPNVTNGLRIDSLSPSRLQDWRATVQRCEDLHTLPGPPDDFIKNRVKSDRVTDTTPHIIVHNARVWTGELVHSGGGGYQVLENATLELRDGLIVGIHDNKDGRLSAGKDVIVVDAQGAWITPGIFDMHSHLGVDAQPSLSATDDTNSRAGPIQPQLRTIDAINAHDLAYRRSVAGGVTTSLILPGSANNIGGQAFLIKLRPTKERTIDSLALELPFHIPSPGTSSPHLVNTTSPRRPRWRHMKHACGENTRRVYSQTRLDLAWNFRNAYSEARKLKREQDRFCERALEANAQGRVLLGGKGEVEEFPDDLSKEALVDLLRGKVKVNTHCYTIEDLNSFIRLSREFEFPVAAFHHAHETYLVPDLLKETWPGNGTGTPAVALFSLNGRYKREACRYLLYQAQQAHHYGLDANLALASITSTPARIAGMSHRVGSVKLKYDADLVMWSDHPLKLGATPQQVWIDGIPQLVEPFPPAHRPKAEFVERVRFVNISEIIGAGSELDKERGQLARPLQAVVNVKTGVECLAEECSIDGDEVRTIDLKGGALLPPLVTYGSVIGLTDIISEKSTTESSVTDPLASDGLSSLPQYIAPRMITAAQDALVFGGKQLETAERNGVRVAITAPPGKGFLRGLSVAFHTGAQNVLEPGAVVKDVAALHIQIGHLGSAASVALQIAELRRLLSIDSDHAESSEGDSVKDSFALVAQGSLPLVIHADKADVLASLIKLKAAIEAKTSNSMRWIIHGGQEAHLIASQLAEADIAVILTSPRSFPTTWDARRALPGPPLTADTAVTILHQAGVRIALGVEEEWQPSSLLWEAAWVHKLSRGQISRTEAVKLVSAKVAEIFGLPQLGSGTDERLTELVAYEGNPFEFGARALAAFGSGEIKIFP